LALEDKLVIFTKHLIDNAGNNEVAEQLVIALELAYHSGIRDSTLLARETFKQADIRPSSGIEDALINIIDYLTYGGSVNPQKFTELRILINLFQPEPIKEPSIEPIITVPGYIRDEFPSIISINLKDTSQVLRELIDNSINEITIVSAFTHRGGIEQIARRLANATNRGVRVIVITQPPFDDYNPGYAIKTLRKIIDDNGDLRLLDIFFLNTKDKGYLHSKVYIADEEVTYIGSANLTGYALLNNIEAGVLVRGYESKQFSRLFKYLVEKYGAHAN
jgi:phosphatidylserine/phosphatidylglycerophosphate/cardiolipin synthase-like enzyme